MQKQDIRNCLKLLLINLDLRDKKRIMVIGCSGSGKSTLAKLLGAKLNLEVFHLDQYYHKPNWQPKEKEEFIKISEELVMRDEWIIDGSYSNTLLIRAMRSDAVIFFDYSRYFCIYRVYKRSIKSLLGFEKRTDLPDGCPEKLPDYEFLNYIWNFRNKGRKKIYNTLNSLNLTEDRLIIFKTQKEAKVFFSLILT